MYADDTLITNAQITSVSGNSNDGKVTATKYANAMWVRRKTGTASQTVDYILNNRYPSVFTSDFRGRGIAHGLMTFDWGEGKLYQGPPLMTFVIKGKKCYDPRLDSSPGNDPTNASYIAWTENPALCWADYAMADYGGAVLSTSIDWASVVTAADVCDELVDIPGPSTEKRYTFNGRIILPIDPDWRENAKIFIDAMLGRMVRRDGIWFIYAGSWDAPLWTIEKTDWLAIDAIKTVAPRDGGRWNTVRCWYVDPDRNWQRVECFPRRNTTYKSADGNEEIALEMEQPCCTGEYEAQRKAEFMLRQSRNQIGLSGRLPPRFRKMGTGDMVSVNFAELGWSSKLMRIRTMTLNPDGSVGVGISEEQEADWTDLAAGEYNAPSSAAVPATNPTTPTALSSFTVQSLAGTLYFDWDSPTVKPRDTRYQIIRSTNSGDASVGSVIWDGEADNALIGAESVTSPFWYYGRAYSNSYYGPYTPNTFGLYAVPAYSPHAIRSVVPDPQFRSGASLGSYWHVAGGWPNPWATLNGSGGLSADAGRLIVAGSTSLVTVSVQPDRRSLPGYRPLSSGNFGAFEVVAGQTLAWSVAFRRRTSLATSGGGEVGFHVTLIAENGAASVTMNTSADAFVRVDTLTVDQWAFRAGTVTVPNSTWIVGCGVLQFFSSKVTSGTIEIGAFDVSVN